MTDDAATVPVWTAVDEIDLSAEISICRCGHPSSDHSAAYGCQAAISYRPESRGGGVGSSYCRCENPDVILWVPRKHIQKFRHSPLKMHALGSALQSVMKANAIDSIRWEEEKLYCLTRSSRCEEGPLEPVYQDFEARRTVLLCSHHAKMAVSAGNGFRKARRVRSVKERTARQEAARQAMLSHDEQGHQRGFD